jgi:hypothetical protein
MEQGREEFVVLQYSISRLHSATWYMSKHRNAAPTNENEQLNSSVNILLKTTLERRKEIFIFICSSDMNKKEIKRQDLLVISFMKVRNLI